MPITSFIKDLDEATMRIVADYPVPVRRLWDAYADPRQIERFWGPPIYPALFTRHDMFPGGWSTYTMTGPEGDVTGGQWRIIALQEGRRVEFRDSFTHPDGSLNTDLPGMLVLLTFEETDGGSRLRNETWFASRAEFEELLAMGLEEGALEAAEQVDDVLADTESFAPGRPAELKVLGAKQIRVTRFLRAAVDDVWRAHHDETLLAQWQLGPDGWSMPECTAAQEVGDEYRYVWREDATGHSFASIGQITEQMPPRREVSTEHMGGGIPEEAPGTVNELTLTPLQGGTLVSVVVTYPDSFTRDTVLGTGMVDGMEFGYARLEQLLAP